MLPHKVVRISGKYDYVLSFGIRKGAVPTSELFGEFVYRSRLGGRGDVSVGVLIVDVVHLW